MQKILGAIATGTLLAFVACGGKTALDGSSGDDGSPGNGGSNNGSSTGRGGNSGGTTSAPGCTWPRHYELVESNNFASPLPGANGIAFDGEELWILAGGFSNSNAASTSTLIRMSPTTLVVDRIFTPEVPDTAIEGTSVSGLTWDGEALWVTSGVDFSAALHRIDPMSGQVTQSMSAPAAGYLSFEGTGLWLTNGDGDAYEVAPTSGSVLAHFEVGGPSSRDQGIAVRACEAWVGELLDNGLQIFDSAGGKVVASALDSNGNSFSQTGPSVFVNGQLVILNDLGVTYYDVVAKP